MSKDEGLITRLANRPLALLPSFALQPHADGRDTSPGLASAIAIIPIMGCLTSDDYGWYGMQTYGGIRRTFLAALAAGDVSAIALLIDSPGGVVNQCFDLADLIFEARGTKPIHAILSESAYSAAYALASAADHISVPRTGGTGSVGVLKMHANVGKMLEQAGVEMTLLHYGDRKIDGNPFGPLSPEALTAVDVEIQTFGDLFVETVARNRGMTAAAVKATQAATYIGQAGVDIGFADSVAAPDAAFADLLATL